MKNINTQTLIANWRVNVYIFSLLFFIIGLPTSNALTSIATIVLTVSWLLSNSWKEKFVRLKENRSAVFIMLIFIPYLIGYLSSSKNVLADRELMRAAEWVLAPLIFATAPKLASKQIRGLLLFFIAAIVVTSIIVGVRILLSNYLGLSNFRAVTLIDHMPFAYQAAFAIWTTIILSYGLKINNYSLSGLTPDINRGGMINHAAIITIIKITSVILIFAIFLLVKSLNGYVYFIVMSLITMSIIAFKISNKIHKRIAIGVIATMIILPNAYIAYNVYSFYQINEYNPSTIDKETSHGNIYFHDFNNKTKENGNYVFLFVCDSEIEPLWNATSSINYRGTVKENYYTRDIIIRYMTSLGLRKDSDGFAKLTPLDIQNIENGYTNHIFTSGSKVIQKRIYETIWEIDEYMHKNDPNDKSLAQRVELAKLSVNIIEKNPCIGIGLGNNKEAYLNAIEESNSKFDPDFIITGNASPVNQYLSYLIRFGILGTLFILFCLLYPFFKLKGYKNTLLTTFLFSMLVANFGDCNFENYISFNYFLLFFCLLLFNSQSKESKIESKYKI